MKNFNPQSCFIEILYRTAEIFGIELLLSIILAVCGSIFATETRVSFWIVFIAIFYVSQFFLIRRSRHNTQSTLSYFISNITAFLYFFLIDFIAYFVLEVVFSMFKAYLYGFSVTSYHYQYVDSEASFLTLKFVLDGILFLIIIICSICFRSKIADFENENDESQDGLLAFPQNTTAYTIPNESDSQDDEYEDGIILDTTLGYGGYIQSDDTDDDDGFILPWNGQ